MGSNAYGVADTSVKDKVPDFDLYGFAIPPKDMIFPHLRGDIPGFGTPGQKFEQWQQPHVFDADANQGRGKEWDFQIFSIIKMFELCRQGNPNMLDSLFTPENCIVHITQVGRLVRDNRKLFVSKLVWEKFRGYAFSQMHKMESKVAEGGRQEIVAKFGYDVKFGYHLLRLLDEAQQLLETGEMDLQRAKEPMKAIRRGEWKKEDLVKWAQEKAAELDVAFTNTKLPQKPDELELKKLLVKCLEMHYGSIDKIFHLPGKEEHLLQQVALLVKDYL
jgi:uncharacterized protein